MRKIRDTYYYVYADMERGKPTALGYSTGKSPLGPFTYRGIVIDNDHCDPESWNNHGSIECVNGQWYVFYHRCSRDVYKRQIESRATEQGFGLFVCNTQRSLELEERYLKMLPALNPQGVIYTCLLYTSRTAGFDDGGSGFQRKKCEFVSLRNLFPEPECAAAECDLFSGGEW